MGFARGVSCSRARRLGGYAQNCRVGESGLVAPGDVAGLAAAIRGLAADPASRGRLGTAGRAAAERDFDRVGIADRFIAHLEGAVA